MRPNKIVPVITHQYSVNMHAKRMVHLFEISTFYLIIYRYIWHIEYIMEI